MELFRGPPRGFRSRHTVPECSHRGEPHARHALWGRRPEGPAQSSAGLGALSDLRSDGLPGEALLPGTAPPAQGWKIAPGSLVDSKRHQGRRRLARDSQQLNVFTLLRFSSVQKYYFQHVHCLMWKMIITVTIVIGLWAFVVEEVMPV